MSASTIAAEINAALAEASAATGNGPLVATVRRKGQAFGAPYDPRFGPDTEHSFKAILGSFTARERTGTLIEATDTKITIGVGDVVPSVSDVITVAGVDYQVYGVDPVRPGGADLMYRIWARA